MNPRSTRIDQITSSHCTAMNQTHSGVLSTGSERDPRSARQTSPRSIRGFHAGHFVTGVKSVLVIPAYAE